MMLSSGTVLCLAGGEGCFLFCLFVCLFVGGFVSHSVPPTKRCVYYSLSRGSHAGLPMAVSSGFC